MLTDDDHEFLQTPLPKVFLVSADESGPELEKRREVLRDIFNYKMVLLAWDLNACEHGQEPNWERVARLLAMRHEPGFQPPNYDIQPTTRASGRPKSRDTSEGREAAQALAKIVDASIQQNPRLKPWGICKELEHQPDMLPPFFLTAGLGGEPATAKTLDSYYREAKERDALINVARVVDSTKPG